MDSPLSFGIYASTPADYPALFSPHCDAWPCLLLLSGAAIEAPGLTLIEISARHRHAWRRDTPDSRVPKRPLVGHYHRMPLRGWIALAALVVYEAPANGYDQTFGPGSKARLPLLLATPRMLCGFTPIRIGVRRRLPPSGWWLPSESVRDMGSPR